MHFSTRANCLEKAGTFLAAAFKICTLLQRRYQLRLSRVCRHSPFPPPLLGSIPRVGAIQFPSPAALGARAGQCSLRAFGLNSSHFYLHGGCSYEEPQAGLEVFFFALSGYLSEVEDAQVGLEQQRGKFVELAKLAEAPPPPGNFVGILDLNKQTDKIMGCLEMM